MLAATRYFTGVPCRRGHVAERVKSSRACIECKRENELAWFAKCPQRRAAKETKRKKPGRTNPKVRKAIQARFNATEKYKENQRRYKARHPDRVRAKWNGWRAKRRTMQRRATPTWANKSKMQSVYRMAAGLNLEVDHIVPLHSPLVCGLHWEGNFQLLPALDNMRKGNRQWPDMP